MADGHNPTHTGRDATCDVECHASFSLRGNKNGIGQTLGSMDADVSTEPYSSVR